MKKNSEGRGSTPGPDSTEIKFAGNDNKLKMYEPKHKRKLIRVLTVVAYVFSVSLAAIMLSLFYMFIYNPGKATNTDAMGKVNDAVEFQKNTAGHTYTYNGTYIISRKDEPRVLPLSKY